MTNVTFGRNDVEVQRKLEERGRTAEELQEHGMIVGTGAEIVDQVGAYADRGAYRIMLQWLDQDDVDGIEAMAETILPQLMSRRSNE